MKKSENREKKKKAKPNPASGGDLRDRLVQLPPGQEEAEHEHEHSQLLKYKQRPQQSDQKNSSPDGLLLCLMFGG